MTLPAGWLPVPLNPDGGLPQGAVLPAPDGDLRLVLVAVAPDLAAVLSAPPDLTVSTSADQLDVRSGPGRAASGDVRTTAASTALAALTASPGTTLSAEQVRVVVLVVSGRRVVAALPALPGRALTVLDGGRLRGHLWIDEITVTAGSLIGAGPTGTKVVLGWRTLTSGAASAPAGTEATPGGTPAADEEDPYAHLV